MKSILLRGGMLLDGSGAPMRRADVFIENGKIAAVGEGLPRADLDLDCAGAYVCPGFIDPHRHIDAAVLREKGYGEVELRQGITTTIGGPCGLSLAPCPARFAPEQHDYLKPVLGSLEGVDVPETFGAFLNAAEANRPSLNTGFFVGNGTARTAVSGFSEKTDVNAACEAIDTALREGAFGLSMGLMYMPEAHYSFDELAACLRVAAKYGVRVPAHIRGEGELLAQSVRELIELGKISGAKVGISHFKAAGPLSWDGIFDEALAALAEARAAGQDVAADAYPYEAGSTTLLSFLPPSWQHDGADALARRLAIPEQVDELRAILSVKHDDWDNQLACGNWEDTVLISAAGTKENAPFVGKTVLEIAKMKGTDGVGAMADMLVREPNGISICSFSMRESNVRRIFALRDTMVISDSVLPDGPKHPRYRGAFPRFYRRYACGENALFTPEEAIRRMTSLPARVYGLRGKGLIAPGMDADITVFDPERFTDRADYVHSELLSEGLRYVLLNGKTVLRDDEVILRGEGSVLRRGNI